MAAPIEDHFDGLQRVGAVYDFTTGDEDMFFDRISLILLTARNFHERGIHTDFVILIHGPATKFVTRSNIATKFENDVLTRRAEIHDLMTQVTGSGAARVLTCGIAMKRHSVVGANLMPFTLVNENVAEVSIALQNKGYAYMQVDVMAAYKR